VDLAVLERLHEPAERMIGMMDTDNLVPGVKHQIIATPVAACLELIA
jgi:hypothetical protein